MKTLLYNGEEFRFETATYATGNGLYVACLSRSEDDPDFWEPYADLTKNLEPFDCGEGCAFVDTVTLGTDIYSWLMENGIAIPTGRVRRVNTPTGRFLEYPEFWFTDRLAELTGCNFKGE